MLHFVARIISRPSSVNLTPISRIPTHLCLWLAQVPLPSTHHSHHPSLPHSFTPGLKTSFSANPSLHSLLNSSSSWLTPQTPMTDTSDHVRFIFSFFFYTNLVVGYACGRLSWLVSAFERTLKQHLVSYRTRFNCWDCVTTSCSFGCQPSTDSSACTSTGYIRRSGVRCRRSVDVQLTAETFTRTFLQCFCFWPSSQNISLPRVLMYTAH